MTRGEKVKHIRVLRGMTQAELAKATGLSPSYVSEVENDRSEMSVKSLEKIAKAFNVDAAFFFDDHAVTIEELAKVNGFEIPDDFTEFIARPENFGYIELAKQLGEEQIPLDVLKMLIDNYKIAMKVK
jgi:transcriptional regulator with XRE-family HTH domain